MQEQKFSKTYSKQVLSTPTKVTRVALENAASIASMLLTTECVIADKPAPAAAPQGGGHGPDMGGMGY